jgi:ribosomal protein S30
MHLRCLPLFIVLLTLLALFFFYSPPPPPAGKVHGSLARAGKVRGQTPKVAKQDKKKTPNGRALTRLKYNRRFVNVGA